MRRLTRGEGGKAGKGVTGIGIGKETLGGVVTKAGGERRGWEGTLYHQREGGRGKEGPCRVGMAEYRISMACL